MSTSELFKLAMNILKEANRLDLVEELVEIRSEQVDLKEKNNLLKQELQELTQQLMLKDSLVFKNGIYWIENDDMSEDRQSTPICPTCWDTKRLILRQNIRKSTKGNPYISCRNCKHNFQL